MNQTAKSIIPALIANLINWAFIVPLISLALGFYLSVSLEAKLAIFNMALVLLVIILILRHQFSPQGVRVIRTQIAVNTYLVKNKVARHIPDAETFEYLGEIYGFHWGNIEMIPHDEFKRQFSTESTLPSILPHCQKFYEQKIKQNDPLT